MYESRRPFDRSAAIAEELATMNRQMSEGNNRMRVLQAYPASVHAPELVLGYGYHCDASIYLAAEDEAEAYALTEQFPALPALFQAFPAPAFFPACEASERENLTCDPCGPVLFQLQPPVTPEAKPTASLQWWTRLDGLTVRISVRIIETRATYQMLPVPGKVNEYTYEPVHLPTGSVLVGWDNGREPRPVVIGLDVLPFQLPA